MYFKLNVLTYDYNYTNKNKIKKLSHRRLIWKGFATMVSDLTTSYEINCNVICLASCAFHTMSLSELLV